MIAAEGSMDSERWREVLDLGRDLLSETSLAGQRHLLVDRAGRLFDGMAALWLAPVLHRQHSRGGAENGPSLAEPPTEIMRQALTSRQLVRSQQTNPDKEQAMAAPLLASDTLLGVLQVQRRRGPAFTGAESELFAAVTAQAAMALRATGQLAAEQRRSELLLLLREVSGQVASLLDLDALLYRVAELLRDRLGYAYVHLFTVDPVSKQIRYRAGSGARSRASQEQGLSYSLDDPQGLIPWVAREGKTALVNDVRGDPRYRPSPLEPSNTQAELAVPFVFGSQVLGVLDVQSDQQHAFDEMDRFVLEALADNVAVALRNATLYRSEQWRRQVADSLREVAGQLAAGEGLDDLLEAILSELERNLPSDAAAIWLLEGDHLCLAAAHGIPQGLCVLEFSPEGHPWLSRALRASEPMLRAAADPYEPLGGLMDFEPHYSAIAAPLRTGSGEVGLLSMVHHSPGRYGPESRMMTSTFASYAAVAIQNARLYESAAEQAYVSTVLLQVAEATQSQTSLEGVLEAVVRLTPMVAGVERCALLLWDRARDVFTPAAAYGLSPEQEAWFNSWIVDLQCAPAFGLLQSRRTPLFVPEIAAELGLSRDLGAQCGFESPWLVPLAAHGEVLGAMLIEYREPEPETAVADSMTDEVTLALIRGIAYQAAAALSNTRLLQERQEEAYVSVALLQVAQAVVSLDDLQDILAAIARITTMLVGVRRCVIFLWDAESSGFRAAEAHGLGQAETPRPGVVGKPQGLYTAEEFPLLEEVRRRGALVTFPGGVEPGPDYELADWVPENVASLLALSDDSGPAWLLGAPLSVMGENLGVMLVQETTIASQLAERRGELIAGIARQAALAVQNDRLLQERAERERLERDLQLAHELQHTLMPAGPPSLPGWDLSAVWLPAREVGGDFFDYFVLPDGKLSLVMADVADKGIPAALFMSLTRTLVRAAALDVASPAGVLAQVNGLLLPDAQAGMFVTAAYGVLSLDTGHLALASAGHNPALLLRGRDLKLERVRLAGTVLGVIDPINLQERTLELDIGDYVILYTDGITEAFSAEGDMYGEERLQAVVRTAAGGAARAVVEAILDSVREFSGNNPQSDDLTLMVLRRTPTQ